MIRNDPERLEWRKKLVERLTMDDFEEEEIARKVKAAEKITFGDCPVTVEFKCLEKDYEEVVTTLKQLAEKSGRLALGWSE